MYLAYKYHSDPFTKERVLSEKEFGMVFQAGK